MPPRPITETILVIADGRGNFKDDGPCGHGRTKYTANGGRRRAALKGLLLFGWAFGRFLEEFRIYRWVDLDTLVLHYTGLLAILLVPSL